MTNVASASAKLDLGPGGLGDPHANELLDLPAQVGRLNRAGVASALTALRTNQGLVANTIQQLESNPKGYIVHSFSLTSEQTVALYQMDDAALQADLAPAIQHLQAGQFDGWGVEFSTHTVSVAEATEFHEIHPDLLSTMQPIKIHVSCDIQIG
jgi:hypothetical protein